MFAQLLITVAIAWGLAEILCRAVLKVPAYRALLSLLGLGPPIELEALDDEAPHADLRRVLIERQRKLGEARSRLILAARATGVTEDLEQVEAELAEVEKRLADANRKRVGRSGE